MKILIDIITLGLVSFWLIAFPISAMMFGGPGATEDPNRVYFVCGLLTYPIIIFFIYYVFNIQFFKLSPSTPLIISFVIIGIGFKLFSYDKLLINTVRKLSSSGYSVKDNKAYYQGTLIKGAEGKSFSPIIIDPQNPSMTNYSKDLHKVYFKTQAITDADPNTFQLVQDALSPHLYFFDKSNVYFKGKIVAKKSERMEFKSGYLRLDNQVLYGELVMEAEPQTFQVLENHIYYSKDAKKIFFEGEAILSMANAESFKLIEPGWVAVDDKNIYRMNYKDSYLIEGAHRGSFKMAPGTGPRQGSYYLDQNKVYYISGPGQKHTVIDDVNLESFKTIPHDNKNKANAFDGVRYWYDGKSV